MDRDRAGTALELQYGPCSIWTSSSVLCLRKTLGVHEPLESSPLRAGRQSNDLSVRSPLKNQNFLERAYANSSYLRQSQTRLILSLKGCCLLRFSLWAGRGSQMSSKDYKYIKDIWYTLIMEQLT
jgi:hypothetical protein